MSLFADGMYVKNLKVFIKKFLELISELSKVVGYKISIQKSTCELQCKSSIPHATEYNLQFEICKCKSNKTCTGFICGKLQTLMK